MPDCPGGKGYDSCKNIFYTFLKNWLEKITPSNFFKSAENGYICKTKDTTYG